MTKTDFDKQWTELSTTAEYCGVGIGVVTKDDAQRIYDAGVESKTTVCVWTHDDYHGKYDTGCGGAWSFIDGTPEDNNTKFCPYCGGKIHEYTKPEEQL